MTTVTRILPKANFFQNSPNLLPQAQDTFPEIEPLSNKMIGFMGKYKVPAAKSVTKLGCRLYSKFEGVGESNLHPSALKYRLIEDSLLNNLAQENQYSNFKTWLNNTANTVSTAQIITNFLKNNFQEDWLEINGEFHNDVDTINPSNGGNYSNKASEVIFYVGLFFKQQTQNKFLSWWSRGKYSLGYFNFYTRNREQWRQDYITGFSFNSLGLDPNAYSHFSVSEQFSYGGDLVNPEQEVYVQLQACEANRQHSDIPTLPTAWQYIESISRMPITQKFFRVNNITVFNDHKPTSSPCRMWNYGIKFSTILEGGILWEWIGLNADMNTYNGQRLSDNVNVAQYGPSESVGVRIKNTNVDYFFLALNRAVQYRNIIEQQGKNRWEMPEFSLDNGVTWVTGNNLYPSYQFHAQLPWVRLAWDKTNFQSCLVVAQNPWQDSTIVQQIQIRDVSRSLSATIVLDGQWISFNHIQL